MHDARSRQDPVAISLETEAQEKNMLPYHIVQLFK